MLRCMRFCTPLRSTLLVASTTLYATNTGYYTQSTVCGNPFCLFLLPALRAGKRACHCFESELRTSFQGVSSFVALPWKRCHRQLPLQLHTRRNSYVQGDDASALMLPAGVRLWGGERMIAGLGGCVDVVVLRSGACFWRLLSCLLAWLPRL